MITDRQMRILDLASRQDVIVHADAAGVAGGVARQTVHRDLTHLVRLGLLEATGTNKGRRYQVADVSPDDDPMVECIKLILAMDVSELEQVRECVKASARE